MVLNPEPKTSSLRSILAVVVAVALAASLIAAGGLYLAGNFISTPTTKEDPVLREVFASTRCMRETIHGVDCIVCGDARSHVTIPACNWSNAKSVIAAPAPAVDAVEKKR